jgi:sigma-B regulation protein RsbQ
VPTLHFFDMLRHGEIGGYVDDLDDILDELDCRRCHFVGHSVSGMIGLLSSLRRPERYAKIITIGASACYMQDANYRGGFSTDDIRGMLLAIANDYRSWAESYAPNAVDLPREHEVTGEFLASLLAMRPDVTLATAQMIFDGDYRNALDRISTPTVILQTKFDPAVPLPAAMFMRDHIRGSRLEILNANGHMPHLTSSDIVLGALTPHLQLLGVAGGDKQAGGA